MYLEHGENVKGKIAVSTREPNKSTQYVKTKNAERESLANKDSHGVCPFVEIFRQKEGIWGIKEDFAGKSERSEIISEKIKKEHCNDEEKKFIHNWCKLYSGQFHVDGDQLACTDIFKHKIILKPNTKPKRLRESGDNREM